EVEPSLGLPLHITEGIASGKEVRREIVAAVSRKREIANFVGRVESAPDHLSTGPDLARPGIHVAPEEHVGSGLEAVQPTVIHQVYAELAEAISGTVIAEMWAKDHAEPGIGGARPIAVAMLQTEIHHPAEHKTEQVLVDAHGRRQRL